MTQDETITRIGISLSGKLTAELDEILKCRGYSCRSEGIRDAIRIYNVNNQWLADPAEIRRGAITLVYDYRQEDLLASIAEIRHRYADLIGVSIQTCIDKTRRVEVLIVHGSGAQLRALTDLLISRKGIESVRITTTPVRENPQNVPPCPVLEEGRLPAESL